MDETVLEYHLIKYLILTMDYQSSWSDLPFVEIMLFD